MLGDTTWHWAFSFALERQTPPTLDRHDGFGVPRADVDDMTMNLGYLGCCI